MHARTGEGGATAGKGWHGFARSVRRFFWLPHGTPRRAAPARPMVWTWLYCLVVGAVLAAFTWDEEVATPSMTMVIVWLAMLDDVGKGVRNRWPAFVAACVVLWGCVKLAYVAVPALADSLWGEFAAFAPATGAALATFVAMTRLPRLRRA
ncbi:hypothetical protein [Streptomyces sp. 2A115]|uniref:hypothetical protein n=1 Tax=Streptomyces sp. 2A115 TaxID=3457439 RepID=UPI003FD35118